MRISLTSACNLRCSYCHNEGQSAPWLQPAKTSARFGNIESLLEVATKYGIKSVKFSGGDPGVYSDFLALTKAKVFAAIFAAGVLLSGCVTSDGRPVAPLPDLALANSLIPTPVVPAAEDQTKIPKNAAPTEERCKAICANAQARIFDESEKSIFQTCREQNRCIYFKTPGGHP